MSTQTKKQKHNTLTATKPPYASQHKGCNKLENKVAIISGEDLSIAKAAAIVFAREKAHTVLAYPANQKDEIQQIEKLVMREGGSTLSLEGDVHEYSFTEFVTEQAVDEYGSVDILVNTAAIHENPADIETVSFEQWDDEFRKNMYGYFSMVKSALPYLKEGASIINTNPIVVTEQSFDFVTAQKAVHALTKSLAQYLQPKKIRVNCVTPGSIPKQNLSETEIHEAIHTYAERISPVLVFLASHTDSGFITGEILNLASDAL